MLKQRPRTPAGWTRIAGRCAVIALGAGLAGTVAAAGAEAAAPAHGTITGNGVNVRNAPSLNGAVVGQKNKGDRVAMYCSYRDNTNRLWDEIQVSSPQWVAAEYVHVDSGIIPACDGLAAGPADVGTEPTTVFTAPIQHDDTALTPGIG